MKLILELPELLDESDLPEILRHVSDALETPEDLVELMDGSYRIETPLGTVFLNPES